MIPVPVKTDESIELHVARLLSRWRDETAYHSSSTLITGHPAYLELIALGTPALPFIFRDMEQTLDGHLSKALRSITGVNPLLEENAGKIQKIAETWLHWARENGYQW